MDGDLVWQVFEAHPGEFDLVLTDLTMPRTDGHEFINRLREESPETPILACSGEVEQLRRVEREHGLKIGLLAKPFALAELLQAVSCAWETHVREPGEEGGAGADSPVG
ncbi:MAG: response regulator [Candidatus Synoicihabitans palmerolidicus]|nr:response regulator [Candidatus Synoicihabitans palmerolidicus]